MTNLLESWTTLKAKIQSKIHRIENRVFTEEYNKQPPHLRLLEHQKTIQEWLDCQYPDANIRKYITLISSYRINAVRRSFNIHWNLKGGKLDLTKYKNLESIYFEIYELATPLTEIDITGCQKIRRISLAAESKIDIIKTHLTREELNKIVSETEQDIRNRTVRGGTNTMGD